MAIIDLGSGTEILTDPDEDLKMQEMMRGMIDSHGVYDESIQRCCCETYNGPIFGCGCCGYDPRK